MGFPSNNLQENSPTEARNSKGDDEALTTHTSLLHLLKSSSFHSITSTNTNDPSPINLSKTRSYSFSRIRSHGNIRTMQKLSSLSSNVLASAFSNAFNHRKQETQGTSSASDVPNNSIDQNFGLFDASSPNSTISAKTNTSHVRPTEEIVVHDESDAFSVSFRSAKADQSDQNIDFSNGIIWDQMDPSSNVSPNSFNGCDQLQLPSNGEIKGSNGKRKVDKRLKHSKRWRQACMHFKLSSCPFNLLRKKQVLNFNKARNSTSDSFDEKSPSFGSAFFSCSSRSSYGDDLELTPPRKSAANPTAGMELGGEGCGNELWMKRILMGKRCRPLDFPGALHYDQKGNMLKEILEKA